MRRPPVPRLLAARPALLALAVAGAVTGPMPALAAGTPASTGVAAGASTPTALARPAADASRGALAPLGGTVPGLTGRAAQQAAGAAADRFRQATYDRLHAPAGAPDTATPNGIAAPAAAPAAAQPVEAAPGKRPMAVLHTDWGVTLPNSRGSGLHATQSVLTGVTTTTGGDYVYAPTALAPGGACIEMTTAYTPSGPDLWAWDWCGGRDNVGKLTAMNSTFRSTYTTTVNGLAAYSVDVHKTSTTANTWTAYLYNYRTHAWDTYFTSTGTQDLPGYTFGWNIFEVYTSVNPSTGAGYYCGNLAGEGFESSGAQVMVGSTWTAVSPSNSSASTPPAGSRLDCPSLRFTLAHANDDWRAQIG